MDIVNQAKLLMISLGAAPVMWLMIGLSIISIAIIVERLIFFVSVRVDFATLARTFATHLRSGDLEAAHRELERSRSLEAEARLRKPVHLAVACGDRSKQRLERMLFPVGC